MQYRRLFWLLLAFLLTACLSPATPTLIATSQDIARITSITSPTNTPAPTSTFTPTSTSTRVPTRTPTATKTLIPTRTPTPTFAPLVMRLPHALYFLSEGSIETEHGARPTQIWRLDPDGVTLTEITHEIDGVAEFDVSLATGRLAYVVDQFVGTPSGGSRIARNQLVVMRTDGTSRQIIVDENLVDGKRLNQAGSLHWSPGGETLAFYQGGVNFYRVGDGQVVKVFANQIDEQERMNGKSYSPKLWSPDGKRLLAVEGVYEGGWWMLYDLPTKTLIRLNGPYSYNESAAWSPDSRLVVFSSAYLMGDGCVDLLQFDVLTQAGTVTIPCQFSEDGYSNSGWPLFTPTGDLLYFHNEADSSEVYYTGMQPLWAIMRSKAGEATSLVLLREDIPVNVSDVLWAEDGSLAIVSLWDGPIVLIPAHESQHLQFIAAKGENLRWGP